MIDKNSIEFITTDDGIRTVVGTNIYQDDNGNTAHVCGVFIHRYNVAYILGLFKGTDKSIEWKRMLKYYIRAINYLSSIDVPGLTFDNIPSTNSTSGRPSKYELQLPEYINDKVIEYMGLEVHNPTAGEYKRGIVEKVLPVYKRIASPEQINSIPILSSTNAIERKVSAPTNFYGTSYSMHKDNIDLMLNRLQQIISSANTGLNALDISLDKLDSYIWQTFNMPLSAYVLIMKSSFETGHNTIVDINYIMDAIFNNDNLYFAMIKCINTACEEQMTIVYKKYNESVIGNIVGTVTIYIGGLGTDNIVKQQTVEIKGDPNREVELFDCVFKESDLITDLMTCYANLKNLTARYANPDIFHYTIKSNLLGCKIKLKEDTFNLKKPLNVTSFENYPKYEDPNL